MFETLLIFGAIAVFFIGRAVYRLNADITPANRRTAGQNRAMAEVAAKKAAEQKKVDQQARIMCPHCGQAGGVTVRQVQRKKGISGGKATGAVLTGGVSMLATGLSRKENAREMSCSNCGMAWDVA